MAAMGLTLYRRHRKGCIHVGDRFYRKCRCPMWAQGTVEREYLRQSLKTANWERAETVARGIEDGTHEDAVPEKPEAPSVRRFSEACKVFLDDCKARNLSAASIVKYERLKKRLEAFWDSRPLRAFAHEDAVRFRSGWKLAPLTSSKELERMKTLFRFFAANGWIEKSPVAHLTRPIVKQTPTLPFTEKESAAIIKSADPRSAIFFRLLLHSGLRIIDAAQLTPDRIDDKGTLFLYQQKTGVPVRVPLPPALVKDLKAIPLRHGFYFANDSLKPASIAEYYRVKLVMAAKAAKVANAHPHRFRDSFSVRLLEKGVPLETVSILLGHSSVSVTSRHYSPWVKTRQALLEQAVKATWAS